MAVVGLSVFSAATFRMSSFGDFLSGYQDGHLSLNIYWDLYLPWFEEDCMNTQMKLQQKPSIHLL